MTPGADARLVKLVRLSVRNTSEELFIDDLDKADATALRLASIGEISRKLSGELKARHPAIEWTGMSKLRNIVAHHYDRLDYRRIWGVAANALEALEMACRDELDRIDR